ncbi:MAG: Gfo/Idh/MocA family oxidoreductase [Planctomycetaceae bacterium]|nr:Gfo/Idh/MocA family oxidoreductase [Planctomycetaceae bacterium]
MSKTSNLNRREVITATAKASLALIVPMVIPATMIGQVASTSPNEQIQLAVIGFGRRCKYVMAEILKLKDVRCRVVADVQASRRDEAKNLVDTAYGNSECQVVRDFREVLARKDIDAVFIATGDRWHATASMMAAEAGKDVYCEKPCGLTIEYCQQIDEVIRRTGRIFQAGTQRRTVSHYQQAVQIARDGKLGRLTKLVASVYTPGQDNKWLPTEPTPDRNVVDWNMWLGPAPWRPYNKDYVAGNWRGQWDFDSGARLLDWGAHTMDLCQMANQADDTMPIEYTPTPKGIDCRYANGVLLEIDFLKDPFGERSGWIQSNGTCPVRFIGEKGWVETGDGGEVHLALDGKAVEVTSEGKPVRGADVVNHLRDFFDCVKTRKPTAANSTVMRRSHIACHAAALSWILQRPLKLDPTTESFIDDDEANRLKSRPQRLDWA